MRRLIKNGTIVNEGRASQADICIEDDTIISIGKADSANTEYDSIIDASGCYVLPGIIDEHVHFREPGLERKANIAHESRAAAAGGVTTFFDMPNTVPQTTSINALQDKWKRGAEESVVNYSFFFGATNDNFTLFDNLDKTLIPGIKLFMGASTGNMLVDREQSLNSIFSTCARLGLPLMVHCEDTGIIARNLSEYEKAYGSDPDVKYHYLIRSEEACYQSSSKAVQLAKTYGTRLHIAHISTAKELGLLSSGITGEAVIAHLMFTNSDYASKGSLIKCNPSVKTSADREALLKALGNGTITCVGTDHAPHEIEAKKGGCRKAASGMPMVQFSLVSMLSLVDKEIITLPQLVSLMSHNPAKLFSVSGRGFLRPGYKADITIVRKGEPWTVNKSCILSKCGWSPLEGTTFNWHVEQTICNGTTVYDYKKGINDGARGQQVRFRMQ